MSDQKDGNLTGPPVSKPVSGDEFYRDNSQWVYNLALRLVGNAADAEDLAQDALIRALKALPRFRGDADPKTWVYRITVNTWKNWVRSQKRKKKWLPWDWVFGSDDDGEAAGEPKGDDPEPDKGLQELETKEAVQMALMRLDPESRAIVVMRDIDGLSYQQISEALSVPDGTVKSRLSRARGAMKGVLTKFMEHGN